MAASQSDNSISLLLGLDYDVLGKSEARQKFFPLVNRLKEESRTVEVTDRDEGVAVLISKFHYHTGCVSVTNAATVITTWNFSWLHHGVSRRRVDCPYPSLRLL